MACRAVSGRTPSAPPPVALVGLPHRVAGAVLAAPFAAGTPAPGAGCVFGVMPGGGRGVTVYEGHDPGGWAMSTADGDTGSASGTAKESAAELLGGDIREGYAEIGDQRL